MKQEAITSHKEILGGTPVFKGTRVPVQSFFDWLEKESLESFLENFPTVSKEQALNVLKIAEKLVTDKKFLNENHA